MGETSLIYPGTGFHYLRANFFYLPAEKTTSEFFLLRKAGRRGEDTNLYFGSLLRQNSPPLEQTSSPWEMNSSLLPLLCSPSRARHTTIVPPFCLHCLHLAGKSLNFSSL